MLKLGCFIILLIPLIMNYWIMSNMISMLTLMFILFFNTIFEWLVNTTDWYVSSSNYNNKMYSFLLLLLMMFLILSFSSLNLIMFYIFFESSLIPTINIIMGWGYQPERLTASYYLLFYTLFASTPMLLSIMFLIYFNNSA